MRRFALSLLVFGIIAALALHVRYGGGDAYPDLSTRPVLAASDLQEVLRYDEPIGNVAVSRDGRIFFTVHPEARTVGNKLLEWVSGAAAPFPNGKVQPDLFDSVLGLATDQQGRLWTIDHGNHGFGTARLLAFDLATGDIVHDFAFPPEAAPAGSLLQDLRISRDGRFVFIADASLWRQQPAIVVYDAITGTARRVLESHNSVEAEDFVIRTPDREMTFLGGLVDLKLGVDGIAIDAGGEWFYYGAVNHSGLYRVRVRDLLDTELDSVQLAGRVERYSEKPLSDGLAIDAAGNVYVTDVEHNGVTLVDPSRSLATLVRSPRIRWADSLSFGPNGGLYIADSALQEQILQTTGHIRSEAPYFVFRLETGLSGRSGL